jgi:hypothetical protein
MIKCFKYTFKKNFATVLKQVPRSGHTSSDNNKSLKSSLIKKSSVIRTIHPETRRRFELIGLSLSDYQYQIHNDILKNRNVVIKSENTEVVDLIIKQLLINKASKEFKDLKTHTIIVSVILVNKERN